MRAAKAEAQYWEGQRQREERLSRSGDVAAARLERTMTDWRRAEAAVGAAERGLATAEAEVAAAEAEVGSARAALGQGGGERLGGGVHLATTNLRGHLPRELAGRTVDEAAAKVILGDFLEHCVVVGGI